MHVVTLLAPSGATHRQKNTRQDFDQVGKYVAACFAAVKQLPISATPRHATPCQARPSHVTRSPRRGLVLVVALQLGLDVVGVGVGVGGLLGFRVVLAILHKKRHHVPQLSLPHVVQRVHLARQSKGGERAEQRSRHMLVRVATPYICKRNTPKPFLASIPRFPLPSIPCRLFNDSSPGQMMASGT